MEVMPIVIYTEEVLCVRKGRKNSCLTLSEKISLFRQIWNVYLYVCVHVFVHTFEGAQALWGLDPAGLEIIMMFAGCRCWD